MMAKPSGQTEAYYHGYEWAGHEGPHAGLDIFETLEAHGYDFTGKEAADFEQGADFRQLEQGEAREFGDA